MIDIEEQLRLHYEGKKLSEERAESILSQARALRPLRFRLTVRLLAAAAVVVLMVGGVLTVFLWPPAGVASKLADEIAVHHLKREEPTVKSGSYDVVQAGLARLSFSILPSSPRLLSGYDLVGGKYCSLRSHPVAQLNLMDRQNGNPHTLYVMALTRDLRNVKPEKFYRDGVIVELWADDGRLFGLASDER